MLTSRLPRLASFNVWRHKRVQRAGYIKAHVPARSFSRFELLAYHVTRKILDNHCPLSWMVRQEEDSGRCQRHLARPSLEDTIVPWHEWHSYHGEMLNMVRAGSSVLSALL
jgi:hypothetical protein